MDIFSKPRDFIDETRNPREPKNPFGVALLDCSENLVNVEDYPYNSYMKKEAR